MSTDEANAMSVNELSYSTLPSGISISSSLPLPSTTTASSKRSVLLCLPGFAATASSFAPLLTALHTLRPEIVGAALEYPGHGESPASVLRSASTEREGEDAGPSIRAFASITLVAARELAGSLREGTRGEKEVDVVLVGHSMGARVALEAVRQFAQQQQQQQKEGSFAITGVILIDGNWHAIPPDQRLMEEGVELPFTKEARESTRAILAQTQDQAQTPTKEQGSSDATARALMKQSLSSLFGPLTPPSFKASTLASIDTADVRFMTRLHESMVHFDTSSSGALYRAAVDAAVGSGVRIGNVVATEGKGERRVGLREGDVSGVMGWWRGRMREEGEEGRYADVIVSGCGHWPFVDKPAEVAGWIVRFLGL